MVGQLNLRLGCVEDAAEIEAVHWAALEGAYLGVIRGWPEEPRSIPARVARWEEWLADDGIDVVVAEVRGSVVGFSALRPCTEPEVDATECAELPTLYVEPRHWRLGYGRRLCLETLGRARERGFSSVVLRVIAANSRARLFYEGLGFRIDGEASQYADDSTTPLVAHRYSIDLGRWSRAEGDREAT